MGMSGNSSLSNHLEEDFSHEGHLCKYILILHSQAQPQTNMKDYAGSDTVQVKGIKRTKHSDV